MKRQIYDLFYINDIIYLPTNAGESIIYELIGREDNINCI